MREDSSVTRLQCSDKGKKVYVQGFIVHGLKAWYGHLLANQMMHGHISYILFLFFFTRKDSLRSKISFTRVHFQIILIF